MPKNIEKPTESELRELFINKYGSVDELNWSPALRWKFGYFNPDDKYEALIKKLVGKDTTWLDVGCGRNLFPSNTKLSQQLADRAKLLVGVDPDITINDNPYVHEKVQSSFEDYEDTRQYSLITLRMVAEHVADPDGVLQTLSKLTQHEGLVVIYTVNKFSPVPLITNMVPFSLHNPAKKILWGTEPEDTFPTQFKMNTRSTLGNLFAAVGFSESLFMKPDDCRTFSKYRALAYSELAIQKSLQKIGLPYPENCLIGVYQKRT